MPTTKTVTFDPESPQVQQQFRDLKSSWKFVLYFLFRLPSVVWWGVRVKEANHLQTEITLPYSWRTQNPYKSIYFAAQVGAAELSTGILASMAIKGRGRISMLVTKIESEFVKKANSTTTFICEDGAAVLETVQKAIDTGEGHSITMTSTGVQRSDEVVSRVKITWSFKCKS